MYVSRHTHFRNKDTHKYAWSDTRSRSVIDWIVVNAKSPPLVEDLKIFRECDIFSYGQKQFYQSNGKNLLIKLKEKLCISFILLQQDKIAKVRFSCRLMPAKAKQISIRDTNFENFKRESLNSWY